MSSNVVKSTLTCRSLLYLITLSEGFEILQQLCNVIVNLRMQIVLLRFGGTTGVGKYYNYCLEVFGHRTGKKGQKIVAAKRNNQLDSQRWGCNQNDDMKIQIKRTNLCLEMDDCHETGTSPDIKINQCRMESQGLKKFQKQQWKWQNGPVGRQIKNIGCGDCLGVRYATDGGWDSLAISAWPCRFKNDKNTDFQFCNEKKKKKCQFSN